MSQNLEEMLKEALSLTLEPLHRRRRQIVRRNRQL